MNRTRLSCQIVWVVLVLIISQSRTAQPEDANESPPAKIYHEGVQAASRMDDEKAISMLEQAVSLDPSLADAHYRLGLLYAKRTHWKQAAEAFQHAIAADPKHIDAYCQLAEVYMGGMGRTADATALLQKGIQIAPRHADVRRLLGAAYLQQNRIDAAIDELQQAIKLDPSDIEAHYTLGLAYFQSGDFEAAIQQFRAVVEHDNLHLKAYFNLGNAYRRTGRMAEARDAFETFKRLNQQEKQIEMLKQVLRAAPTDAKGWYQLGQLLTERRQWNDAAVAFEKYIALKPQVAHGYEALGYLYLQLEAHEKALKMYEVLVERHPEIAAYRNRLGVVYAMMEKYPQAIEAFQTATRLNPSEPNFHLNLSKAHRRAGNASKADTEYQLYQRLKSQNDAPKR